MNFYIETNEKKPIKGDLSRKRWKKRLELIEQSRRMKCGSSLSASRNFLIFRNLIDCDTQDTRERKGEGKGEGKGEVKLLNLKKNITSVGQRAYER